jgi:hypothetical protein
VPPSATRRTAETNGHAGWVNVPVDAKDVTPRASLRLELPRHRAGAPSRRARPTRGFDALAAYRTTQCYAVVACTPGLTALLEFAVASNLLTVLPGPGILPLLARGVSSGRRVAVLSAFGAETGALVYVVATAVESAFELTCVAQILEQTQEQEELRSTRSLRRPRDRSRGHRARCPFAPFPFVWHSTTTEGGDA